MIDKNSTKEYLTQLLRNDVEAFNQYRINTGYKAIDLSGVNLFGANLCGDGLRLSDIIYTFIKKYWGK